MGERRKSTCEKFVSDVVHCDHGTPRESVLFGNFYTFAYRDHLLWFRCCWSLRKVKVHQEKGYNRSMDTALTVFWTTRNGEVRQTTTNSRKLRAVLGGITSNGGVINIVR